MEREKERGKGRESRYVLWVWNDRDGGRQNQKGRKMEACGGGPIVLKGGKVSEKERRDSGFKEACSRWHNVC